RKLSPSGRKEKTPSEKTYGCHTAACSAIEDLKFLYHALLKHRPVFPGVSTKLPLQPSLFQLPLKRILRKLTRIVVVASTRTTSTFAHGGTATTAKQKRLIVG